MKTYLLAGVALIAGVTGCVSNHASLEIYGICSPPTSECGTSGKCEKYLADRPFMYVAYLYPGTTDRIIPNHLFHFIQFNNQLPNNAGTDPNAPRENTNDATIEEYRLSYQSPGMTIPSFTYLTTQTVPANGISSLGVTLIPTEVTSTISTAMTAASLTTAVVTVSLKAAGHYKDGTSFETGEFKVPVTVYNGVYTISCAKAGEIITGWCPNLGQDASITCEAP